MPDGFLEILATCRSREISCNIIIQNLAQLKTLFKDSWESITGNSDILVYLGGNEQSTHKFISEMLGKTTIDKKSSGETLGNHGSSNRNYDVLGRDILDPSEVRKVDNKKCLIFIKGFDPIYDDKYHTAEKEEYKLAMKLGSYEHKKRQWLQQHSSELRQRYEENEAVMQENRQLRDDLGGSGETNADIDIGHQELSSSRITLPDGRGGKQTLVRRLQEVRLNEEQTEIIDYAIGKGMGEEQLLILLRDGWTTEEMRKLCEMFLQEAHG